MPFNPNIKDGRGTSGLAVDKSNWANTIDTPPFEGYAVTCGVTFTFGGLRINNEAQVLNTDYQPIHGLYAAGGSLVASSISIIRAALGSCPALYLVRSPVHQPGARRHKLKYTRDQVRAQPSGSLPSHVCDFVKRDCVRQVPLSCPNSDFAPKIHAP